MQLIKSGVASINHKDKKGIRVLLSIARGDDGLYFIVTGSGEDTMHRFDTEQEVTAGIADVFGSASWDLQFTASRTLEYTLCRTNKNTPLVTLDSPLGNGQEIRPEDLRRLAAELMKIANLADKHELDRGYRPVKGSTEF